MLRVPLLALSLLAPTLANDLTLVTFSPARHALQVPNNTDVTLTFDRALDPASVPPLANTVHVSGSNSGPLTGTFSLENGDQTLRFDPANTLFAGEVLTVTLSTGVGAADGTALRQGFEYRFRAVSGAATLNFDVLDVQTARDDPGTLVRVYGGQACDFDEDGWLDLAVVNEVASDVRVLPNSADGSGLLDDILPTFNAVGSTPSPNENADFDGDGHVDLVTGNTGTNTMSVLYGNGDGTFDPAQSTTLGGFAARGVAVFDFDGDGDADVCVTTYGDGKVSRLRNDGNSFTLLGEFEAGANGEFGLASGDMNEDGLLDLIVGFRTGQAVGIWLSNGDGTFSPGVNVNVGGAVWMIVPGDVNGDGHLDISTGNGSSGTGSILFGDGNGGLSGLQTYPAGSLTTATDLGDLDGDGDLDWMVSDFGSGRWTLYENDGSGSFTQREQWVAQDNPACAVFFDLDLDGDLDIVLLDELADDIILLENSMPGTRLCEGSSGCPCGNDSVAGSGQHCTNSTGQGAVLLASGTRSVGADDLVLHGLGSAPNQFGLVFSGTLETHVPFGDGIRCLDGTLKRYPVLVVGGDGTFELSAVASLGAINAGETRLFQGWYRDPMGPCGGTMNFTSAIQVTFEP